jgi:hypothetical protein
LLKNPEVYKSANNKEKYWDDEKILKKKEKNSSEK